MSRLRSEGEHVSQRVYDCKLGGISGGYAEYGSKWENLKDIAWVRGDLPRTQQMAKPMSRSVKVRLGKQDSSSSSFLLKMFLKSMYYNLIG